METSIPGTEERRGRSTGPPVPPVPRVQAARRTNTSKIHVEQGDGQQGPAKLSPVTPQTKQKLAEWKVLVMNAIAVGPKDTTSVGRIQISQKRPTRRLQPECTASGIDQSNMAYQLVELLILLTS